jgi:hypothetical protein
MWAEKTISTCEICNEPATSKQIYIQMVYCWPKMKNLCDWCYKTLSLHFRSSICIDACVYEDWPIFDDGVYVHIHDYKNIRNANVDIRSIFFNYRNEIIRAQNMNYYKERVNALALEHSNFNLLPNDMINVIHNYLQSLYQL